MIITHHGIQSFKVSFGDTTLLFDPISKDSKNGTAWRGGADVTLVSINDKDMNGYTQANRGDNETFVIKSPGEYEVQGVFVKGLPSVSNYSSDPKNKDVSKINTIYTVNLENIKICFLGALSDINIPTKTKESIGDVDILFVPVGDEGVLTPADAYKFAVSLEPSIIIPMNYSDSSLKSFIKEGGQTEVKPVDKLTIKKKDLEGKEGEIVILGNE